MEKYYFSVWIALLCLCGGVLPQFRDKNISAETDAVQALLARYLQRRLQGTQFSTPPPPAVLFSTNHQSRIRQTSQKLVNSQETSDDIQKDQRDRREDYEDYEDDLQGFEDSAKSRTRIDLLAGDVLLINKLSPKSPRKLKGFIPYIQAPN